MLSRGIKDLAFLRVADYVLVREGTRWFENERWLLQQICMHDGGPYITLCLAQAALS